jgi:hypothetical protein
MLRNGYEQGVSRIVRLTWPYAQLVELAHTSPTGSGLDAGFRVPVSVTGVSRDSSRLLR